MKTFKSTIGSLLWTSSQSDSTLPSDPGDDGGASYEIPVENPLTIRFHFNNKIGTFANINSFLYFCAQKDQHHIQVSLADNNVLTTKARLAPDRVVDIVGTPFNPGNRKLLRPLLGELPKAGEHMRAATYQREDLGLRRRQLHRVFHVGFRFSEEPVGAMEPLLEHIRHQPTLGVHLRFTRHYGSRPDYAEYIKSFQDEIDRRLSQGHYRQLFVATHMAEALAAMQQRYGSLVLHYEQYRNPNRDSDWLGNKPIEQERREVIIDMQLLASCRHVIGGPSNVLYAALWYRPKLSFSIVPILKGVDSG